MSLVSNRSLYPLCQNEEFRRTEGRWLKYQLLISGSRISILSISLNMLGKEGIDLIANNTAWLILLKGRKALWEGKIGKQFSLFLPTMPFDHCHCVKSTRRYFSDKVYGILPTPSLISDCFALWKKIRKFVIKNRD